MHIIAGLVALVGVILFFVIRANNAARAGRDIVETVDDVRSIKRNRDWQRDAGDGKIPEVDDPQIVATAMMCAIAACEGEMTANQTAHIRNRITSTFQLDTSSADDLLGQGRWLAGQVSGANGAVLRWSKVISGSCTQAEKRQLVEMLESTATVESKASDEQRYAIQMLKTRLDL